MQCFLKYLKSLSVKFPPTADLAIHARNCYNSSHRITSDLILSNPDQQILNWSEAEFNLFKLIENDRYLEIIKTPFHSVENLITTANSILQRRKSRAGSSLELQLTEIFKVFGISYSSQPVTENKKNPDFIFPDIDSYINPAFSSEKLVMLAAKRTCKERWAQILNEADRIKTKHLFTLQQGISKNQLEEMYRQNVCLVVPRPYLSHFPEEFRSRILSLNDFNRYVLSLQI
jgi:type II restriction enzyme